MREPQVLLFFNSLNDAIEYRNLKALRGWIYFYAITEQAVLFPRHMTPRQIINHTLVSDHTGRLIGENNA